MISWKSLASCVALLTSMASADVILSNYPPTNDTNTTADVDNLRRKALSFAMPAVGVSYNITSITLRLQNFITPADVAVLEIRDHTGSTTAPGTTVVGSFTAPTSAAGTVGDFTFTPTGVVTLLPGTSYWIELHGADSVTSFDWRGSSPAIAPTGIATYGGQSLFTTNGGTSWTSSLTINTFRMEGVPAGGSFGACCLGAPTYGCTITTPATCATQGGTYAGDNVTCPQANCPPPPTGACCLDTGCTVMTQLACTTAQGTYAGDNVTCAAANCLAPTAYAEVGDTGDLPSTAQVASGNGSLLKIRGTLTTGEADMFKMRVCDAANFSASTVGATAVDTILTIYNSSGRGVALSDDEPAPSTALQSRLTNTFVGPAGNGDYYLAVVQFNKQATNALGQLWINDNTPGHEYRIERAPDGPGAADPLTGWTATTGVGGPYTINLTGSCFIGAGCYADCDGVGGLTANDFICFVTAYNAGAAYANCDGVGGLTANDFICFVTAYNNGCP
jgi:hypothetical protein